MYLLGSLHYPKLSCKITLYFLPVDHLFVTADYRSLNAFARVIKSPYGNSCYRNIPALHCSDYLGHIQSFLCIHPLSDDAEIECLTHGDDRINNCRITGMYVYLFHREIFNLYSVNWQTLEVIEGKVSGAKIILCK